jgi:uncharacterized membrane protein YgcG
MSQPVIQEEELAMRRHPLIYVWWCCLWSAGSFLHRALLQRRKTIVGITSRNLWNIIGIIVLMALGIRGGSLVLADPILANPDQFGIELFADLASLGRPKAFQLTISSGEHGFPEGLYVTTGPAGDDRSDRLLRIDRRGRIHVVQEGFHSNETMVFARGAYGDGILITEPLEQRILRLRSDGTRTTFASVGTAPFGPTGMNYGPDPQREFSEGLFVVDSSGEQILLVDEDGETKDFVGGGGKSGGGGASGKWLMADPAGKYGGGFIFSTFNIPEVFPNTGAIFSISRDGTEVTELASGLNGVELLAFGPSRTFGSDLFVPTVGGAANADGGLFTLSTDGKLTPFMTGLDAVSVVFDSEGILGGGMFIADINDGGGAGKIWRVFEVEQ